MLKIGKETNHHFRMKRKIVLLLLLLVVLSCRKDSDLIPDYKIAPQLQPAKKTRTGNTYFKIYCIKVW